MQIKKTYQMVNPELLYNEVRDFVLRQGAVVSEAKLEAYSIPTDSSSFISRGTLVFRTKEKTGSAGKECLRAHIVGSAKDEVKLIISHDESLFSREKIAALLDDLDFIFGSYEKKRR